MVPEECSPPRRTADRWYSVSASRNAASSASPWPRLDGSASWAKHSRASGPLAPAVHGRARRCTARRGSGGSAGGTSASRSKKRDRLLPLVRRVGRRALREQLLVVQPLQLEIAGAPPPARTSPTSTAAGFGLATWRFTVAHPDAAAIASAAPPAPHADLVHLRIAHRPHASFDKDPQRPGSLRAAPIVGDRPTLRTDRAPLRPAPPTPRRRGTGRSFHRLGQVVHVEVEAGDLDERRPLALLAD